MDDLLRIQQDFADALRDATRGDAVRRWLVGDAELVGRRIAIHRANVVAAADKALSGAYPVVRQVVGGEFFQGLAREYHRAHPSTSGDLGEFGDAFAPFLAAFEHVQDMPWLADLARLEWAAHRAYGAADAPAWDPAALASVDDQAALRFAWSPGIAVVASDFPIVRVWTIHQPAYHGEFSVDWNVAETALVARAGFAVIVQALLPAEAAFLASALAGGSLGDATTAALQVDAAFDLGALLARAIGDALVCGVATPLSHALSQERAPT